MSFVVRFLLLFGSTAFLSSTAFSYSQRYDLSLTTSYTAIVGSDSTFPKVFISTPLTPGLSLDFHYAEDTYFSSLVSVSYRSVQFLNDSKNNITVENEGLKDDIGIKYYLFWNAFDQARMIFGIRYINFYYFQSNPAGFIEAHSDMGAIGNLGLEYNFIKNADLTFSLLGFFGLSTGLKVKTGYSAELEGRMTYRYSKNLSVTGSFAYEEFHNDTIKSISTKETSQGRADLNLKLGLQKIF